MLLVKGSCPAAGRAAGTVVALVVVVEEEEKERNILFGGRGKMYTQSVVTTHHYLDKIVHFSF